MICTKLFFLIEINLHKPPPKQINRKRQVNANLKKGSLVKRRFTKPWFREMDFFFKKTKLAYGRNHDFVKPWFRKLASHFFKFPVQGEIHAFSASASSV